MLHTKLALEPRATSVSMLGAPCEEALEAVDEELLVDDHDDAGQAAAGRAPMAMWLPSNKSGSGQPHIMCPMEKYISTSRKPSEAMSRRLSTGRLVVRQGVLSSAHGAVRQPLSAPRP